MPSRHLIRVMKGHVLTHKKTNTITKTKTKTHTTVDLDTGVVNVIQRLVTFETFDQSDEVT